LSAQGDGQGAKRLWRRSEGLGEIVKDRVHEPILDPNPESVNPFLFRPSVEPNRGLRLPLARMHKAHLMFRDRETRILEAGLLVAVPVSILFAVVMLSLTFRWFG